MADLRTYTRKHVATAHEQGVGSALSAAAREAALYAMSVVHERMKGEGDLIWDDEWDICLVVDACRADLWREVIPEYDWLGDATGWSVGSASPEWYGRTFDPVALPDGERIGVVTANPFAGKPEGRLPALLGDATPVERHVAYADHVYRDSWGCETERGYLDVTHPGAVTERAYDAWRDRDLDRLVVHYMQPHLPFRSRPEWFGRRDGLDDFGEDGGGGPYGDESTKEIWKRIRDGEHSREEVWRAYRDNLHWVLEDIDRLRTSVDAEVLITSDHGNALGEWGVWSHPPNKPLPALRRVPWSHVSASRTGKLRRRDPASKGAAVGKSAEEKLAALGYQ